MKVEILENNTLLFFPESISEETAVKSIQGTIMPDDTIQGLDYVSPSMLVVRILGLDDPDRDEYYTQFGKPIHQPEQQAWEYEYLRMPDDSGFWSALQNMGKEGWELVFYTDNAKPNGDHKALLKRLKR